ncbi:MAG: glycerol-3-phosphate responsive antiterminator [Treponema sp.]|nr:glycerol-3-phosphate responsive antiterminator [Treponema sp.]
MMEVLKNTNIVAAVRNETDLTNCLQSSCKVVFLLSGTLLSLPDYVAALKKADKTVFVHMDLVEGLSNSKSSVDYIKNKTAADGIISTKQNILKYAKSLGFMTILRIFLLDSKTLDSLEKICCDASIDILEILPGIVLTIIPETVAWVKEKKMIIGGGLIKSREIVSKILQVGAQSVSTSDTELWNYTE